MDGQAFLSGGRRSVVLTTDHGFTRQRVQGAGLSHPTPECCARGELELFLVATDLHLEDEVPILDFNGPPGRQTLNAVHLLDACKHLALGLPQVGLLQVLLPFQFGQLCLDHFSTLKARMSCNANVKIRSPKQLELMSVSNASPTVLKDVPSGTAKTSPISFFGSTSGHNVSCRSIQALGVSAL
eukprot:1835477-Amphidinium_carterae.1